MWARVCKRCHAEYEAAGWASLYCQDCYFPAIKEGTSAAHAVKKAIKGGLLPPPTTLLCVDCGNPAKVYEHRDYSRPLDVVPACFGCNSKRGAAYRPPPSQEAAKRA